MVVPRAFVAIRVPATRQLTWLLGELSQFGRAVGSVPGQNLHITLRFLGQCDPAVLERVAGVLGAAVGGGACLDLPLKGLGAFPDNTRPRVVWVGADNTSVLFQIEQRLTQRLFQLGFDKPHRPWTAHMTVARVRARPPWELIRFIETHAKSDYGVCRVEAVDLMISDAQGGGPRYTTTASVRLAQGV